MINLLLVDDHALFREAVKQILLETSYVSTLDETNNEADIIGKIIESDYDVVILDISMPGKNGFDILKQIKKYRPNLPVLMISTHSEEQYAHYALKLGAMGYLTKESVSEELIKAIRKISIGGKYVSSSIAQK